MSMPVVSVILPTHNRATELPRALESVLAQTVKGLEVIVVDDASTDATRDVLRGYESDERVRTIRLATNLGGSGARNVGVAAATANLIAFQDSDDYWFPDKLQMQLDSLERHPECGLVYCGSIYYGDQRSYYLPSPRRFERFGGDMSTQVLRGSPASTQTLLIRRELLEHEPGPFDESLKRFQDWDLVIRLAQRTEFAFVEEPLVVINQSEVSISSVSVNDAVYRSRLLDKYRSQFAASPRDVARHRYISGRTYQKNGQTVAAAKQYAGALQQRTILAVSTLLRRTSE